MNKMKKIGVSALAGSLVAVAANAGEMSVSGSAILTYVSEDALHQQTGNNWGTATNVKFTGTGDVNGMTVTIMTNLTDENTAATSSGLTVDMGDMGKFIFDQGMGGNGLDAYDDMTPTAWEEANDGMTGALVLAGDSSVNTLNYSNTVAGFGINIMYDPATGDADQEDGEAGAAGTTGSSQSIAVSLPVGDYVEGLSMGVASGTDELADGSATTTDIDSWVVYANYSMGPVTVGMNRAETSGGTTGHGMQQIEGMGITFNVNDNLSVGYTNVEQEYANAGGTANVVEESTGLSMAYTMGSATISIQNNEQDNPGGSSTASDEERTEINLALAF